MRREPYPDPGVPNLASPLRFLVWMAAGQRGSLIGGVCFGVLWMGAQALTPGIIGAGIDAMVDGDAEALMFWTALLVAAGAVRALAGTIRHYFAVTNWISAALRVQQLVNRHVAHLGAHARTQVSTGEVVAITSSDIERIGNLFDVTARLAGAILSFFLVAGLLLRESTTLGLIVIIGVPVLVLALGPLIRPLERRESQQREQLGKATALAADTVAGVRVLRGIGGEEMYLERFNQASQEVRAAGVRTASIRSTLEAMQVALPGIFVVMVTYLAARLAVTGEISVGSLVAFYGYSAFLVLPLRTCAEGAERFAGGRVAAARVVKVLATTRTYADPDQPAAAPADVKLRYLVDQVTGLEITPGRLTAIVCDEPEAATAVGQRLGGYERPAAHLGGIGLDNVTAATARSLVLFQDKDPVLMAGQLRDVFEVPHSGAVSIDEALHAAAAGDVLEAVPEGLDGELTERARSLSGGQRQRLSLARSLFADPPILVLDEPTSAVDAHTEARVGQRLRQIRRDRTTVLLTTSPLLLAEVDRVVFIADNHVVAVGEHRELMRSQPGYRAVVTREDP